jgi:anti-sigma regulatory factor (Ser/Thr protein kinase)/anti-anti-sigma regulatory factor
MSQAVNNNRTISVPTNPIDAAGESFEQTLHEVIADRPALVLLDCATLERVISSHINLLWIANILCRENGIELQLLNPPSGLLRILNALDLTHTFIFSETGSVAGQKINKDIILINIPKSYSDQIFAETDDINKAIARFVSFLSKIGAGETTIHELRTIFYEIATNIRLYSGLKSSDQFAIDIVADRNQITITFTDKGRAFDSCVAAIHVDPDKAAKFRKRRGFGLAMIRTLADHLAYRPNRGGGNILTVCKKWRH